MKKLLLSAAALATIGMGADAYADHHMEKDATHANKEHAKDVTSKADIVDTAASQEEFSTLVAAVKAADLAEVLKGEGPFTVFAPTNVFVLSSCFALTNDAFEALPDGTVEELLKPENKGKLQALLTYHVVSGKIMADDIKTGSTDVETVQGSTFNVNKSESGVTVDGANVTKADIKTSNGVIHVIDKVIMPQ